ncbi:MAG TPA: phosphate ABC transporter ATP-binding protein, partial [Roseiflexaceae bacterium]|nr:phosphate ABC transporter ATP-binding protein [Roseiflexaceae bacterium]
MTPKVEFTNYSLFHGPEQVLREVSLAIPANSVVAVFGPAGGGKSGLLRSINRMAELQPGERHTGDVLLDGASVFGPQVDVAALRRRAPMVFTQPLPLPMSIFENTVYGLRLQGVRDRRRLAETAERALRDALLWDEVKDRLDSSALALSGGQQQRLGIARALALEPEILLLDTPTAALDPITTARIEELVRTLRERYTIVLVPHNVQQATRVADVAAFFLQGQLIEAGPADQLFVAPRDERTERYITGRF